jgi:Spy/CpxP family protein refolding chaperone
MKKLSLTRKLLYTLVVLLLIINVVTVFSVVRFLNQHKDQTSETITGEDISGNHRTKFFSDELQLDDEQQNVFRNLNRSFNQTANQIYRDLSHLRLDLVDELGSLNPDTLQLNNIAIEIGSLHTDLKMLTTEFYLGLKAVCTPEQKETLDGLFRDLLNDDNQLDTPRGRGSGGRGYGRRNIQQAI